MYETICIENHYCSSTESFVRGINNVINQQNKEVLSINVVVNSRGYQEAYITLKTIEQPQEPERITLP